jgi:uncharacterized protein (DUF305 family)
MSKGVAAVKFRNVIVCIGLAAACLTAPLTAQNPPGASAVPRTAAMARARSDSARLPYTQADIEFVSGMIGHHAQALVMAAWAPSHGADPAVARLCERIINAQNDEIALMQRWLRDRHQPVPEAKAAPMKMMMNGSEHEMLMPGMLTEAQMKQLDAARGHEFDRLFLTFMIQHHRGAITMVTQLFEVPGAGQDETVFKMANDIQADQGTEINRMTRMLFTLPGDKE